MKDRIAKDNLSKDIIMKIRAHHGMCLAYFEGKGYSDDFCNHMQQIVEQLKDNPIIQVVAESDLLCSRCPNLKNNICNTPDVVYRYDSQVLSLCGLTTNDVLTWKEFSSLVNDNILSCDKRKNICGTCQWNDICSSKEPSYPH